MTADALVLARTLWDEGLSCAQIAFCCHTTKHSIVGLAHRRAWPPRPSPIGRRLGETRVAGERVPERPHHKHHGMPDETQEPRRTRMCRYGVDRGVGAAGGAAAPAPNKGSALRVACKPERLALPTATFQTCQWINGSNRRTWKMCGCPAARGPWCAEHLAVVYTARPRLVAA
ncbi:MAG TPA: hypothetical protein VGI78_10820 [Acetobacteraceae bacterium]|jgi:hypothetical protein